VNNVLDFFISNMS